MISCSSREDLADAKVTLTEGRRTQVLYSRMDLLMTRISTLSGRVTSTPTEGWI
jgi:hypothetical protein